MGTPQKQDPVAQNPTRWGWWEAAGWWDGDGALGDTSDPCLCSTGRGRPGARTA